MFDIETELKKLPHKPGVYIMHDKDDLNLIRGEINRLINDLLLYANVFLNFYN